jgi:cytidylate kinase
MRVIAIDGPAAAGKGTLARRLAVHFGLPYLDTGLLYRAVGRRVLDRGGDPADAEIAAEEARGLTSDDLARPDLRDMQAAAAASVVASNPAVRAALLAFQRNFAAGGGAILDGRDIGTVIFPDAPVKLYVTASPEARGLRRYREILAAGGSGDLAAITDEVRARDAADAARAAAPMKPADDAVLIDTTELTPDAAFEKALGIAKARLP